MSEAGFSPFSPPAKPQSSDSGRPMKQDNESLRFGPQELPTTDAARTAPQQSPHAHQRDPHTLRREHLDAVDSWLREQARAAGAPSECPTPEELYEFGGGPGAGQFDPALTSARRAEIDRHLAACAECDSFVDTLSSVPPSPVVQLPPPRRAPMWLLTAMAAGLVFVVGMVATNTDRMASSGAFPVVGQLRGEASTALAAPTTKVLVIDAALAERFPALAQGVHLELRSAETATSWRFDVFELRAAGASNGERPLFQQGGAETTCRFRLHEHGLHAGSIFAWEARATEAGLTKYLGRATVDVVRDDALTQQLLAASSELDALHLLHAGGWRMEALALARALPPSGPRDRYLEALLAR